MENHKKYPIEKPEEEWKKELSEAAFHVLRNKGTESPFSGKFNNFYEPGLYSCKGCGAELFSDQMKFNGHCGWPSFDDEIPIAKIEKIVDHSHGMTRTEVVCGNCGGHLGHLFTDGPTETGNRYCINSISLDFKKT